MNKALKIALNAVPIVAMIGLIPVIENDYFLTIAYIVIIVWALRVKRTKHDVTAFTAGLILMTVSEVLFVSTGVETFARTSFFGLMPLWLPFLWGYGFIVIKRVVHILDT